MRQKKISIGKSIIKDIIKKHHTPLYIYDSKIINKSLSVLQSSFLQKVNTFYSLKANPNLAICHEFCQLGTGAEVCSLFELETALKAGFPASNIIFLGPAKTDEEIQRCLETKIYAIVCESLNEIKRIAKIASKQSKTARVMLRINPNFNAKNAQLKMGGKPTQFGIDQDELLSDYPFFLDIPNVELIGIHIYNGTRILDPHVIADNVNNILQLASTLAKLWQIEWEVVDVGGGIGIPYFEGEKPIDLKILKKLLQPIFKRYFHSSPKTKIILESGRYLVGESGYLFARILDIKQSKGEVFIITDAGSNCFAAAGFNSLFIKNFPISVVKNNMATRKNSTSKCSFYNITGPLCTPGDIIAKKIKLQDPCIGDLICIHSVGAYGLTASPTFFLSQKYPAEVLIKNDTPYLVRKRFSIDDLLKNQRIC